MAIRYPEVQLQEASVSLAFLCAEKRLGTSTVRPVGIMTGKNVVPSVGLKTSLRFANWTLIKSGLIPLYRQLLSKFPHN